jgi:hypothetical protein
MDTGIVRELIDNMGAKWPTFVEFIWTDALITLVVAAFILLATAPTVIFLYRWIDKAKDKTDASFGKALTVVGTIVVVIITLGVIGSQISTLHNPEGAAVHHVFDKNP